MFDGHVPLEVLQPDIIGVIQSGPLMDIRSAAMISRSADFRVVRVEGIDEGLESAVGMEAVGVGAD